MSASFGTRPEVLPTLLGGVGAAQGITGNLALGFKADRVVGLLVLAFADITTSGPGGGSTGEFTVGPELQVAIVRSDDRRAELLADAGIGFGHLFAPGNSMNTLMTSSFPSNVVIAYQLGVGGRYWFHRHFALQGLTGFAGEAFVDLDAGSGNVSAHGAFASLGILAVF